MVLHREPWREDSFELALLKAALVGEGVWPASDEADLRWLDSFRGKAALPEAERRVVTQWCGLGPDFPRDHFEIVGYHGLFDSNTRAALSWSFRALRKVYYQLGSRVLASVVAFDRARR